MKYYSNYYYSTVDRMMSYANVRINRNLTRYGSEGMDSQEVIERYIDHHVSHLDAVILGY